MGLRGRGTVRPFGDSFEKMTSSLQLRILVVDDEALIRWSLSESLRLHGHTVLEAASASDPKVRRTARGRISYGFCTRKLSVPVTFSSRTSMRQLPVVPLALVNVPVSVNARVYRSVPEASRSVSRAEPPEI